MKPFPYQKECLERIFHFFHANKSLLCVLPTGTGKCLGRGTPVLMFDGRIVAVEDIQQGDMLIGPDSEPRRVLSTTAGREMLYRVTPTKGDPYVVNESHILSLRMTPGHAGGASRRCSGGEIVNISVLDYIAKSKTFKHCAKGYRSDVEWKPSGDGPFYPYLVGLWLGDGHSVGPVFTNEEPEVVAFLEMAAAEFGLSLKLYKGAGNMYGLTGIRKKRNPFWDHCCRHGMDAGKHIPLAYKTLDRSGRMRLLAGIIDTDGHLDRGGCIDIIQVRKVLADDIAFVARSLGLAAYVKECCKGCQTGAVGTYWRVNISGDIDEIPVLVPRKKAKRRMQKKNVLSHGITVDPIGIGDYFGFELEGDGLFLLGDFTVTHNTNIFSWTIDAWSGNIYGTGDRILVVAHREELITQAAARIEEITGEKPDVEQGSWWAEESGMLIAPARVVVASIQTLANPARRARFDLSQFGLIIVDEAHHAVANSYLEVVGHFTKDNNARVLGVTATADRQDEISLGKCFDYVAYEYDILTAIKDGYLCPIKQEFIRVSADFSKIEGMLTDDKLDVILSEEKVCHEIAIGLARAAGNRQTVVFCAGVEQAHLLAEVLNRYKINCARAVSTKQTSQDDRRQIVKDYREGKFQFLINFGIFLEGFDAPETSCVAMARPTQSRAVYAQAIGRGTRGGHARPVNGKTDLLVLDFVGNSGRHKLVSCADALGGIYDQDVVDHAHAMLEARKGGDVADALVEAQRIAEMRRALERANVLANAKVKRKTVDPFNVLDMPTLRESGYTAAKVPTVAMNEYLEKQGITNIVGMTFGEARRLISEIRRRAKDGLCTYKQAKMLTRYGYSNSTSVEDAGAILDALAANGWKPINYGKWQNGKKAEAVKRNKRLEEYKAASDAAAAQLAKIQEGQYQSKHDGSAGQDAAAGPSQKEMFDGD